MSFLLREKVQTCLPCFSVSLWNQMRPRQLFSFVSWLSFKMMKIVNFCLLNFYLLASCNVFIWQHLMLQKRGKDSTKLYSSILCKELPVIFVPQGASILATSHWHWQKKKLSWASQTVTKELCTLCVDLPFRTGFMWWRSIFQTAIIDSPRNQCG